MYDQYHDVVVIGAGTMGAALAAHFANAGMRVTLLDIVPPGLTPEEEARGLSLEERSVRDRLAREGLERARKSRPASFFSDRQAALVEIGNLEDDLESAVAEADWVLEAIVENLDIKRDLMARLDDLRQADAIVTTNTSGIPIQEIAAGRSEGFRKHFFGTHFFNPPRYLKLLEVIPTDDTDPDVLAAFRQFAEVRLGKGVVLCKDTPNFIANRLGSVTGAFALDHILEEGYTVKEVDGITGPPMGRPKTATFRLLDLVGLDVWEHVGTNLAAALPHDEIARKYLESDRVNDLIHTMVERGWLGNKREQGFYKTVRENGNKEFWELNLETLEYEPPSQPRFDSVGKARDKEEPIARLVALLGAEDRAGDLARALTFQGLSYASHVIPEIADTPLPVDRAMRWGFGHDLGPFETWDELGVAATVQQMEAEGYPPADWVREMLGDGNERFYQVQDGRKVAQYDPEQGEYTAILPAPRILRMAQEKSAGKILQQNAGATLVDLGDGVVGVEFHTKMNALDDDVFQMIRAALDLAEEEFEAVVIGNDADNFSVGANLMAVVLGAQNQMWDQLEKAVRSFQNVNMRIRYFPRPVVIAPAGLALGGGAELVMHAGRAVAAAELYTGQVELGVGVIPAGGGTKEIIRRLVNPPMRTENTDVLPFLQRAFEQVGQAKVATSAEEALEMGLLGPADRVVMNRDHLLAEAKREALHMARTAYHPPVPERVYAAGRDALAALRLGIYTYREGNYISEYDAHVGEKLAFVMTGGELSLPAWVDEQYLLDLECEAFLSLCGEEKTQQRMWHMLQTGKPLRN